MTISEKQRKLKKHKTIATGLLFVMACVYVATFFVWNNSAVNGYIRAFAEAALVGGLADWFAVTALFRHPLGLPIPHTNLIGKNKKSIGDNLGNFIAENFLTAENIRPRITQLFIAKKMGRWLQVPSHQLLVKNEILRIIRQAIQGFDAVELERVINQNIQQLLETIDINKLAANTLKTVLDKGFHEKWISQLAVNLANYIQDHTDLIKEKVKSESFALIPDFVDDMIAAKITKSLSDFLNDIATDAEHPQRQQITEKLYQMAYSIETSEKWTNDLQALKQDLLSVERTQKIAQKTGIYLQDKASEMLARKDSAVDGYMNQVLEKVADDYLESTEQSEKLDRFVRVQVFKLMMRHRSDVARLISQTIDDWETKSLSRKFELEVGKDLQYIRLNGTLVGGLVGLIIHFLSQILAH